MAPDPPLFLSHEEPLERPLEPSIVAVPVPLDSAAPVGSPSITSVTGNGGW